MQLVDIYLWLNWAQLCAHEVVFLAFVQPATSCHHFALTKSIWYSACKAQTKMPKESNMLLSSLLSLVRLSVLMQCLRWKWHKLAMAMPFCCQKSGVKRCPTWIFFIKALTTRRQDGWWHVHETFCNDKHSARQATQLTWFESSVPHKPSVPDKPGRMESRSLETRRAVDSYTLISWKGTDWKWKRSRWWQAVKWEQAQVCKAVVSSTSSCMDCHAFWCP